MVTLLVWVGEAGVQLYSSGQPGGAWANRLLYQAQLALDAALRLKVVRKMYAVQFGEEPPARRSVEQLRGIEGARVREYKRIAAKYGVEWKARNCDTDDWDKGDLPNRCLSAATACLYGVTEAAVLAAGYAPAVGFIHTGKPGTSFVYDIADVYKFETVVPVAFRAFAAKNHGNPEQAVRIGCRDMRETKLLERIIPDIERCWSLVSQLPG
ncbi:MAG: type I-E CRISPR-associated endonuclease Cas1e [Desulfosudis oleivorans]|nr:type I-E CRISPR-associated endonuclease Cas1e [Desulfosudis oleivorans]